MEPTDIAGVAGTVLRIATSDNFLMTMMVVPMVIVIERLISGPTRLRASLSFRNALLPRQCIADWPARPRDHLHNRERCPV